jgi:hypothetical protein
VTRRESNGCVVNRLKSDSSNSLTQRVDDDRRDYLIWMIA